MKISTWLTTGLYILLLSRSATITAQDRRMPQYGDQMPSGYNAGTPRTLFGLPMPQQWSGARPSAGQRRLIGTNYSSTTAYSDNCVNGQCSNGQCPTGQCVNGVCANGQCANGQCANYSTTDGLYSSGYRGTSNCPNGQCPPGIQAGGWTPRSTRSMPADPFRGSVVQSENNQWSPRSVRESLTDLPGRSNYRREDLDLRSEYFGDEQNDRYGRPVRTPSRSNFNSNEWTHPSGRSLEAPADTRSGVARF